MINTTSSEKINAPLEEKKKPKWGKKEKTVGVIVVGIFVMMFIAASSGGNKKTTAPESPKPNIPDISLDIKYSPSYPYYEEQRIPVITIINLNNVYWKDCKMKLNDLKYTKTIMEIPPVSYWREIASSTGDKVNEWQVIPITQFTMSDGTRFNPITTAVKSVCVSCNEPKYSSDCWEMKFW